MISTLYFAYGSNLGAAQMEQRCSGARFVAIGCVRRHCLAFTRESKNWIGGVADLLPDPTSEVWGVLYEVTSAHWTALDQAEGAPKAYGHASVTVESEGQSVKAVTYVVVTKRPGLLPSHRYWTAICQGAHERSLPRDYRSMLEGLAPKPEG